MWSATDSGVRLGDGIWRNGGRGEEVASRQSAAELDTRAGCKDLEELRESVGLQLGYLLPWLEWSEGSLGIPVGVRGWNKAVSWARKFKEKYLCDLLQVGAGR